MWGAKVMKGILGTGNLDVDCVLGNTVVHMLNPLGVTTILQSYRMMMLFA